MTLRKNYDVSLIMTIIDNTCHFSGITLRALHYTFYQLQDGAAGDQPHFTVTERRHKEVLRPAEVTERHPAKLGLARGPGSRVRAFITESLNLFK